MAEYIDRKAAIDYIKENQCKACSDIGFCGGCAVLTAKKLLQAVPAADVAPVRHGRWQVYYTDLDTLYSRCSDCLCSFKGAKNHYNYCPNCGAKMDGEAEE